MIKRIRLLTTALTCVALLMLSGCSKGVSHEPSKDSGSPSAAVSPSPASQAKPTTSSRTPGGDPIDLSEYDGKIVVAEKNANNSGDETSRVALAHAYLARASALTKARQYRSALGDYRRTLKYEPGNKEATDMSSMIINILKEMNIPVPPEGQEPPPKPMTGNEQSTDSSTKKPY